MKLIQLIICLLMGSLFFSCEKEELYTPEYHIFNRIDYNYYFKGIIKDTSNQNSVAGYRLFHPSCGSDNFDTIIDSTYFFHHKSFYHKTSCPHAEAFIEISNTNDSLVFRYSFPVSAYKDGDTSIVNIYF